MGSVGIDGGERDHQAKRVLVTGAAGFIGSHLAEACLDRGWELLAIDSLTPSYDMEAKRRNLAMFKFHPGCELIQADLLELDLSPLLDGVDVAFHLAAQPGTRSSWGWDFDAYVDCNVRASQRVLEAAARAGLSKLVIASSSSVYGEAARLPIPEDAPLRPVSPYGATKAMTEHLAHAYWCNFRVPVVRLRYFSVYGPRQRPDMAFHRWIAATLTGEELRVFGDGQQTRDFTFVDDAVEGTLAAAERGDPGAVFNLGGGHRGSVNEVLRLVEKETGSKPRIRYEPAQPGDVHDTGADTTRARAELGFSPQASLETGLKHQVDWQRSASRVASRG